MCHPKSGQEQVSAHSELIGPPFRVRVIGLWAGLELGFGLGLGSWRGVLVGVWVLAWGFGWWVRS